MSSCLRVFVCQIVLLVGLAAGFGGGTIDCPCMDSLVCDPKFVADPVISCRDPNDVPCCSDDARAVWTAVNNVMTKAEERYRLNGDHSNQTRRAKEMFGAPLHDPADDLPDDVIGCRCLYHRNCDLDLWHRFGDKDTDTQVFGSQQPCADPAESLCCPGSADDVNSKDDDDDVSGTKEEKEDVFTEADEICPCMRRFDCPALPYGLLPTDIRDYGALPHCKSLGNIRCCPRAESVKAKREAALDPVYNRHNRVCPCMAKRQCRHLPEYGRVPTDVRDFGQLVPCALPNRIRCCPRYRRLGKRQATQEQNEEFGSKLGAPLSLFELPKEEGDDEALEDDEDAARGTLPCVEKARCEVEYGTSPLDIARFGVLPHCKNHHLKARCVAYRRKDDSRRIDFRLKTYRHSFDSAPATIDDHFLAPRGIPPRIYVNENGTLVVDGGSPVVVVPSAAAGIPAQFPAATQSEIPVTQADKVATSPKPAADSSFPLLSTSSVREPLPQPPSPTREILLPRREHQLENQQQVSSAKTLFQLFEALQSITQSLVSNEKARSVQLEAKLDGNSKPLFLVNATRGDFLNFLKSMSKFNLITLKKK